MERCARSQGAGAGISCLSSLLFAACAYELQHPWNTDRDIGFSRRQTPIADTVLPHITLMASTISIHGAHDQNV